MLPMTPQYCPPATLQLVRQAPPPSMGIKTLVSGSDQDATSLVPPGPESSAGPVPTVPLLEQPEPNASIAIDKVKVASKASESCNLIFNMNALLRRLL